MPVQQGRPSVPPLTWYSPGCMALAITALVSFVLPALLYPLLALTAVLWSFLFCLRTVENSSWRKDMRRKQAAIDAKNAQKLQKQAKKVRKAEAKSGKKHK